MSATGPQLPSEELRRDAVLGILTRACKDLDLLSQVAAAMHDPFMGRLAPFALMMCAITGNVVKDDRFNQFMADVMPALVKFYQQSQDLRPEDEELLRDAERMLATQDKTDTVH